jgi:hypothetical protein
VHLAELRGHEPVVVYQMGKVGSSTIVTSLRALQCKMYVHHVHALTEEGIAAAEAVYRKIGQESHVDTFVRSKHLLSSRYLCHRIKSRINGRKWKFITLVREPISRNISSFFQEIDHLLPNFLQRYKAGEVDVETMVQTFFDKFDHEHVLQWPEKHLQPVLDLDLYESDFPKDQGYQIYSGEHYDLLLLKLEALDECAEDAFHEFLGIEKIELVKTNVSKTREYAEAYQQFKEHLSLPDSYIDAMYSSQYMQHFYSQDEIAAFAAQWKDRNDASV